MRVRIGACAVMFLGTLLSAVVWAQVELPKGLKGVAPVYPGAEVSAAVETGDGAHAVMEVQATPKEVMAYYRKALEGKGWKVEMEMTQRENAVTVFSKGGQALTVVADGSGGEKTTVGLTLGKK